MPCCKGQDSPRSRQEQRLPRCYHTGSQAAVGSDPGRWSAEKCSWGPRGAVPPAAFCSLGHTSTQGRKWEDEGNQERISRESSSEDTCGRRVGPPPCLVSWGWGWTRSQDCFTFTALLQVPRPCGLQSETRCVFPCILDPRDQSVWSDPVCGGRTGSGKGNGVRVVLS